MLQCAPKLSDFLLCFVQKGQDGKKIKASCEYAFTYSFGKFFLGPAGTLRAGHQVISMRQSSQRGTAVLKNRVSYFVALMAVLTGAAVPAHAFTLGDLRGNAVIGRALDVSVPVSPGAGEEALASCLSADVFFADSQQLNPSVTVTPVTTGSVSTALVRIRSGSAVSEPVVSVLLRSTCGGAATSRRFVLLTDFPAPDLPSTESALTAGAVSHVSPAPLKVPQSGTVGALPSSAATPGLTEAGPAKAAVAAVGMGSHKPRSVAKKRLAPVKPSPAPEPVVAKPVLKLDPQPVLPVVAEAPAPASSSTSAPASAPALSDEAVRQALLIQSLQNDVKTLKELAAKNQASVTEFQTKLHQAESDRVPMTWFYLVVGLLGASLAALVWVLRRQQNAQRGDWWQHAQKDAPETQVIVPTSTAAPSAPMSDFGKFINQFV